MIAPTVGDRVAAGIHFLDDRFSGPEWREKIVVEEIDISCGGRCIIGQLMGNFFLSLEKLDLTTRQASLLGFTCLEAKLYSKSELDELTREWKLALSVSMANIDVDVEEEEIPLQVISF